MHPREIIAVIEGKRQRLSNGRDKFIGGTKRHSPIKLPATNPWMACRHKRYQFEASEHFDKTTCNEYFKELKIALEFKMPKCVELSFSPITVFDHAQEYYFKELLRVCLAAGIKRIHFNFDSLSATVATQDFITKVFGMVTGLFTEKTTKKPIMTCSAHADNYSGVLNKHFVYFSLSDPNKKIEPIAWLYLAQTWELFAEDETDEKATYAEKAIYCYNNEIYFISTMLKDSPHPKMLLFNRIEAYLHNHFYAFALGDLDALVHLNLSRSEKKEVLNLSIDVFRAIHKKAKNAIMHRNYENIFIDFGDLNMNKLHPVLKGWIMAAYAKLFDVLYLQALESQWRREYKAAIADYDQLLFDENVDECLYEKILVSYDQMVMTLFLDTMKAMLKKNYQLAIYNLGLLETVSISLAVRNTLEVSKESAAAGYQALLANHQHSKGDVMELFLKECKQTAIEANREAALQAGFKMFSSQALPEHVESKEILRPIALRPPPR